MFSSGSAKESLCILVILFVYCDGTIPRRMSYSTSEQTNNPANYEEAVSRQGPDELTTRVWWDVN